MTTHNRNLRFRTVSAAFAVAALSCALVSSVFAQDPNGGQAGQQQGGGQGGFGGGQGGFGGGRRGGQGGPGGMPFAMGTVTGGDAQNGTITINSQFGGGSQTIKVSQNTEFDTQETIAVKDLKVGDSVVVVGIPATITANTITAGDPPSFMPGAGRRGGQGGPGAPGAPGGFNGGQPNGQNNPNGQNPAQPAPIMANANATGKVSSTSPLTIRVSDSVEVVLKLAKDAKITKYKKVAFSSLKVGDVIFAQGQAGADGTFNATGVGVNMQMGGGGRGMMGGFGGGFGGGPGGAGGGGFGGGRRGGRGGGAGGAGANGGNPGNNN